MAVITLKKPETCIHCGAHNFKIQGVIYNGDLNYTKISIRCMKCGAPADKIQEETR